MSHARWLTVDRYTKTDGGASCRWSHDQMQIAGVKSVRDPPVRFLQRRGLRPEGPIARHGPLIQAQSAAVRGEVLGARRADVIFGRLQVRPVGRRLDAVAVDRHEVV